MMNQKRSAFSSYLTERLSEGRVAFTAPEAQAALGIGAGALLDAAERQQKRGHLIKPRRGFYVIVPPQFHSWGAPPPSWYIEELMAHSEQPYYVGLLTAAQLHGTSHRAAIEFQVITDRQLGTIRAGRSNIVFRYRKDMEGIADGIGQCRTDTGHMKTSGVELTAMDLLRYPRATGGLDRIVTLLVALGEMIDPERLATLSRAFERSVAQRLGHLLERLGHRERSGALHDALTRTGERYWVELDPLEGADRDFSSKVVERDERWRVKVRRAPKPDT